MVLMTGGLSQWLDEVVWTHQEASKIHELGVPRGYEAMMAGNSQGVITTTSDDSCTHDLQ